MWQSINLFFASQSIIYKENKIYYKVKNKKST